MGTLETQYKYKMSEVLLTGVLLVLIYLRKINGSISTFALALLVFPLLVAGLIIMLQKNTVKEVLIWVTILVFVSVNFILSKSVNQLVLVIMLWAFRDFPFRAFMKVYFWGMIAQFIYVFLFRFIWNPAAYSITQVREVSLDSGLIKQVRYDLGYGHPNFMHLSMFTMIGLYVYLRKRVTIVEYLLMAAMNYGLYLIGGSRTGMILTYGLIGLLILEQYIGIRKSVAMILSVTPIICLSASLWAVNNIWNVPWLKPVDDVLQSRITIARLNIEANPTSLMGKVVVIPNDMGIDMGWINSWETTGIIFTVGLVILNVIVLQKLYKYGEYKLFIFLFLISFYQSIENISVDPLSNVSLLFVLLVIQVSAKQKRAELEQGVDYAK